MKRLLLLSLAIATSACARAQRSPALSVERIAEPKSASPSVEPAREEAAEPAPLPAARFYSKMVDDEPR
jgi:hypothetical protein